MANREPRTKPASVGSWLSHECTDSKRSRLAGERHILELISLGATLPGILNKLCIVIDFQIGNVVSLVLLPDEEEYRICSITQSAAQLGLHLFSSTDILSCGKVLFGTLEIYGCDPRRPTQHEYQLIQRVVHLAAIALQRHKDEEDSESLSRRLRDRVDVALESPTFIN